MMLCLCGQDKRSGRIHWLLLGACPLLLFVGCVPALHHSDPYHGNATEALH
jgi:hypothetical protein